MPAAGSVPASLGKRALARLIDVVAALVLGGGLVVGGLVGQQRAGEPWVSATTLVGGVVLVGQGVVQWWLLGRRGYTLGRVLTGLRVLAADDGRPIGLGRALLRESSVLVAWSTVLVGLMMTASVRRDPRRQGWQDRLAGDVVFDVNVGVDPVHVPPTPRQATERLQSLLGDDDRRRHRAGPVRERPVQVAAEIGLSSTGAPDGPRADPDEDGTQAAAVRHAQGGGRRPGHQGGPACAARAAGQCLLPCPAGRPGAHHDARGPVPGRLRADPCPDPAARHAAAVGQPRRGARGNRAGGP